MTSRILILDYGSQFTQLIARRIREARVYSEIHPPTRSLDWIREWKPTGIVLSGGPASVYGEDVPTADPALLDIAPVLGICYGMNLIAHIEGGTVVPGERKEYGRARTRDRGRWRDLQRLYAGRAAHGLDESRRPGADAAAGVSGDRQEPERARLRRFGTRRVRLPACSSIPRWRTRTVARRSSPTSCSRCPGRPRPGHRVRS